MITRVPQEIRAAQKALNFDEFIDDEPLSFQLYYGEKGKAEIINTIYLEDGNPASNLFLEVFNESDEIVTFSRSASAKKLSTVQAGGNQAATATKCHFAIRWEKDLGLNPDNIGLTESTQWQLNYDLDKHFFTIYFLHENGLVLLPNGSPNGSDKIQLIFTNFTANNRTVKSSNIELLYGGASGLVLRGKDKQPLTEQVKSEKTVFVTNYPGKTQIPLQFRFLGSNTILNDGTANTLKLKIINSPLSNNTRPILLLDKNSKFIVSFEKGAGKDALLGALDQVANLDIKTNTPGWKKARTTDNALEWTFTTQTIDKLQRGEGIELEITDLKTNSDSGLGYLYIDYQNIGSYPDGRLVVPIEKTPLLYRDIDSKKRVGIGTTTPNTKLEIKQTGADTQKTDFISLYNDGEGSTQESRIVWRNGSDTKYAAAIASQPGSGRKSGDLRFQTGSDGALNDRMIIKSDGNVGIGTTTPSAKLHVNDGNAIITGTGKVGIGTNNPSAQLHVDNGNAIITGTGKVGIGTITPSAQLHVDNGNAIITGTGQVGIGTTTPLAKLHVENGDAIITGKVGIGTTTPNTKLEIKQTGGDHQQTNFISLYNSGTGATQESRIVWRNGTRNDYAAAIASRPGSSYNHGEIRFQTALNGTLNDKMIITSDGKVGIGTTDPSAKLDVNGSVKLGDGSTAWNRIICGKVVFSFSYSNSGAAASIQLKCYGKGISGFNRTSTGFFQIDFEKTIDPEKTVIIASTEDTYGDNFVSVSGINTNGFQIQTKDKSGNNEDTNFHFIAIELSDNFHKLLNS